MKEKYFIKGRSIEIPEKLVVIFLIALTNIAIWYLFFDSAEKVRGVDGMARLVRIQHLWETGQWFDSTNVRINAPFGFVSQWTRPLDALILLFSLPLMLFMSAKDAIASAAWIHAPILQIVTCFFIAGTTKHLAYSTPNPKDAVFYSMFLVVFPMQFMLPVFGVGNADHHALQMVLFVGSIYYIARSYFVPDKQMRSALYAGVALGLGIWVSLEMLPACIVPTLWFCGRWIRSGDRLHGKTAAAFVAGITGMIASAIVLNPPTDWVGIAQYQTASWDAVVYDRVSIVHVIGMMAILAGWLCITNLPCKYPNCLGNLRYRIVASAVVCAVIALGFWLFFPSFYGGPAVEVDSRVREIFYNQRVLASEKGLFSVGERAFGLIYLACMAIPVTGLLGCVVWGCVVWARSKTKQHLVFFFLLSLCVHVGITLTQVRHVIFPYLVSCVPLAVIICSVKGKYKKILLATILSVAPLFLFVLSGSTAPQTEKIANCDREILLSFLQAHSGDEGRPYIVLSHMDHSSYIVYYTDHNAIASGEHRNGQGLLDAYDMLNGHREEALNLLAKRRVDIIALCPSHEETRDLIHEGRNPDSLYQQLLFLDKLPPDWLVPVDLPKGSGDWKIYRVRRQ